MKANKATTLGLLFAGLIAFAAAGPVEDLMFQMPECEPFEYEAYSGLLQIQKDKTLHYTFVASMNDPTTDPLVIWFNGGPGCSSMLAFLQEHGPCVVDDNSTDMFMNPYPWNMKANMIYLEAPAGVGYSQAATNASKHTNDMVTSQDNLAALLMWFDKFPEFKNHDFYVSGESYGGVYVPYLSW